MSTFFLLFLLLNITSCSHIPGFKANTEKKRDDAVYDIKLVDSKLDERAKQLNTASKDLLTITPEEFKTPNSNIAISLLTENERILGMPIESIDVEALLKKYIEDNSNLVKDLADLRNNTTLLLKEKNGLEVKVDDLTKRLSESNKGFFGKLMSWFWGLSITGMVIFIIVMIVSAVLCPTLIPRMIGWVVIKVPQLIGFIGITSIKAVDSMIDSIQDIRVTLSHYRDDDVLPIKDVRNMIDGKLSSHHDNDIKNLIEHRKKKRRSIRTNKN